MSGCLAVIAVTLISHAHGQEQPALQPPVAVNADVVPLPPPTARPAPSANVAPQSAATVPERGITSSAEADAPAASVAAETLEHHWYTPLFDERKLWKGQVLIGLSGADGNTERFNSRFGVDAKREGESTLFKLDLTYAKSTANGIETEHKLLTTARNEWKLDDSPWSLFVLGDGTYDEFQTWDYRLVASGGVGYQFIKSERTSLAGRFGSGFSRDLGGTDNRFIPELNFGLDFERKLTDFQSLKTSVEYFPSVLDFADFRLNTKAAWECDLDNSRRLKLRLGIADRYQSEPEGAKPNDIDYFAELGIKF